MNPIIQLGAQLPLPGCLNNELLWRHVVQPEKLTEQECQQVSEHVGCCERCAAICDALDEVDLEIREQVRQQAGVSKSQMQFIRSSEDQLVDIWRLINEQETRQYQCKISLWRFRSAVAAIAACIVVVAALAWKISIPLSVMPVTVRPQADGILHQKHEAAYGEFSNNPLAGVSGLADLVPNLPDIDSLNYVRWRDEYREWCARSMPWIPKIQSTLAAQGVNVDWIELAMVSGDLWQFDYDPRFPASPLFAKENPKGITYLAHYYGLNRQGLFRAIGLSDSALDLTKDISPGQQYGGNLQRWRNALLAYTQSKPKDDRDLLLFSLSASQYLATSRTAVYLWTKEHPQETQTLLNDANYYAMVPQSLMSDGDSALHKQLREQSVVARNSIHVAMEWFLAPARNECAWQVSEYRRHLAMSAEDLLFQKILEPQKKSGR